MRDPINGGRVAEKHSQSGWLGFAAQVVAIVVTGPNNYTGIKANKKLLRLPTGIGKLQKREKKK